MNILAICISSLLLLIAGTLHASIGMGESYFETPGGNTICSCDGLSSRDEKAPGLLGHDSLIYNVTQFYFYQGSIVGKTKHNFFIFNETTEEVLTYDEESDWNKNIENKGLNPFITRWLKIDNSLGDLYFLIQMTFFISYPLIAVYLFFMIFFLIRGIGKEKFILKKGYNSWVFIAMFLTAIYVITDVFWINSI